MATRTPARRAAEAVAAPLPAEVAADAEVAPGTLEEGLAAAAMFERLLAEEDGPAALEGLAPAALPEVAEALEAVALDPEPEPPPIAFRERVRLRIGGDDAAPEIRDAEVVSVAGYGVAVLVHLHGQYDAGLDPKLKRRGHPARGGEGLTLRGVIEGTAIGQFSRL